MVDRVVFCATLTDRRGRHTPFVQTGAKKSDTGADEVKPGPKLFLGWKLRGVVDENAESDGTVRPLRILLVIRPLRRTYVVVVR